jgi:hypothetical protein
MDKVLFIAQMADLSNIYPAEDVRDAGFLAYVGVGR